MEENDDSNSASRSNVYITLHGKIRRRSGLLDKSTDSPAKRQKTNISKQKRRSLCGGKKLNLAFVEDFDGLEINITTQNNIRVDNISQKSNLIVTTQIFEKKTENDTEGSKCDKKKHDKESSPSENVQKNNIGTVSSNFEDMSSKNIKENLDTASAAKNSPPTETETFLHLLEKSVTNEKINLDASFIVEDIDTFNDKVVLRSTRRRNQRRLSGLFPRALNAGFLVDNTDIDEKENIEISDTVLDNSNGIQNNVISVEQSLYISDEAQNPLAENTDSNVSPAKTPIKSKLRKRPKKKSTEEDIIKYYTDKTIKNKQTTLETIFEVPAVQNMSVKKFRRFINFNERMSSSKIKKRHTRVVKYKLWQNASPVSMDYFVSKIVEVERDL